MICYKTGSRRHSTYTASKKSILVAEEILYQYFKSQDRRGQKWLINAGENIANKQI
jgi:hypothetical protein